MPRLTDNEFIAAWASSQGSPAVMSAQTGLSERGIYARRKRLSDRGVMLHTVPVNTTGIRPGNEWQDKGRAYRRQNEYSIDCGSVLVFSDAHFWPDQPKSAAHLALLTLAKELRPKAVIANGDVFDGARVSRHAPLGWSELPSVKEEMDICDDYMHEIRLAANPKAKTDFFWNVGNHDQRFDRMLVSNASEYEGVVPRLEDRFSDWSFAWSININDHTMVKHRYHNGIHAGYNNTLKAGRSIVTGHLHRLLVTPWGDYNGRRYGVDTGTLSDPMSPQFDYGENNPTPHCSGFAVLTFKNGMLLPPELCEVIEGVAYFRGQPV